MKKFLQCAVVDIALVLAIYLRVLSQKTAYSNLGYNVNYLLISYSLSALFFIIIGICCAFIGGTKIKNGKHFATELVMYGIPAIVMVSYWYIIHLLGVSYFVSYTQSMRYVGAIVVGVLLYKTVRYIFKKY